MLRSFACVSIVLASLLLSPQAAKAQGGPPPNSATFLRTDMTTLGNWHAAYGADGYSVAGNGQSLPGYASFAVQNQEDFTWTSNTTDTRALQTADGSNRIAAVWYNASTFNFDLNLADGNSHQFALYALDWDASGRAETVQIVDATSQTVLDTESISSFTNGVYLVWNITGHVQVNITRTAGNNAVVNGVFFGGSSVVSSVASFVRTDTSTQGNWHGAYGADGYSIANDSQSIPSYASFAVQNQQNFTWSDPPTDVRALETGNGSDRIASVWYNTPEFNFDLNLTDGNSHQFALYAVDWDNSGRAETIQILDAATDALLDTRSISNFTNGLFLVWNVKGHIKLNVIQTAGNNAVVSGVFFGANSTVSSSAAFLRTDTTTQGNWHGTYGSDGYSVANDSQSLPSYASFAVQNQQDFTWSNSPTDARSLQTGSASGRIAAVWYSSPEFNFDVNFTDGNSHQFAFYAVDWDSSGRAETIQILDAATDALLDTRSISNFANGLYLVWNVAGHVRVNVIQTAGNNAVISGVFFGGGSTINSTASFVRTDTTTQGSWHGTYGSDGYSIANDSQSLPSYANFAVQNQANWTWLPLTTDPRALQTGSNTGSIAATWYNTPEFNLDVNLTDGQSHQLALYAMDWDSSDRAETIELLDAATGALLDSRNISSFVNGLYLVWNVSGHVKFNIILTDGNNAVVSGVFWDPVPGSGGTNPVLQSISITPTNPSTGVGAALQFTALGTYSNGQTQNLSSSATWSSSSSQVATVNASGLATSQVVGNTTISASVGSISSSTVLTVTASSPPGITASLSPAPNSAGWNNSAVTVSFTCTSGSYAVASCPAPQFVNTSGANQLVTGTVVDTAGLSASIDVTLNIEKTLPTIANVTPADQSVLTSPTGVITGSVVSSLTNVNGATCNGSAASFTSGSFSCNFSLNPGVNLVMVLATDVAGNMAGTRLHLIYAAALPAPTSLQITPANANVLVGATQQFTAVDQLGNPRTDATWTVNNTNVATIFMDSSPILTGVATGSVTLTASVGGATAQVQVTVLSGVSLPISTAQWTAPPIGGFTPVSVAQAVPAPNAPGMYTISSDNNGDWLVQALTRDGQQMWQQSPQLGPNIANFGPVLVQPVPDAFGGLILFFCAVGSFQNDCELIDLDGQTGQPAWQYISPLGFTRSSVAVREDGSIVTTEYDPINDDDSLVVFAGSTGQRTSLSDLDSSSIYTYGPVTIDENGTAHLLLVDGTGQNVDLLAAPLD
ncbi:MAG: Ig-like domain-containing protein, partial [Candidatus Acidiferrum sp.]